MATNAVNRGAPPAKLTRADRLDLMAYTLAAVAIAFLPHILACCGAL